MKSITRLLIVILVAIIANCAYANDVLRKFAPLHKPKIHPYTNLMQSTHNINSAKRINPDNNKLLVILVDFQEEIPDNPKTTGNGKFLLEADSTYRTSIASPPHNKEYYENNLEALRYYYLAASQNTFNLQYDVWPKDKSAYTLPQPMGYYNPPGSGSALFLSRIEEYFKSAFELADADDPDINFASYGHFMIIHAGSDWQHDIFGDTPSDLPSFYIKVSAGKEAVVDNGSFQINQACNVPSTTSQDFDSYESGGVTYYTGYGALNGVMAHEFGHSMGLVDLYNTYNFSPMVGQFDIMDSGGSGVTEDSDSPGVLVEGILPCLPGAFSREIMFGDTFKQNGLLHEFDQVQNQNQLGTDYYISASSQKQIIGNIVPNIYKFPLNEYEYILVENRSVDPDGDGFTSIKGALDGRVVLYPTAYDDPDDNPTYEYDYLLPSFIDANNNAIGGGLLVWHVDERVLYQQGQTDEDGVFVSNFDRNTVNYRHAHRGVSVIEADGLDDLGNDYSYYWTGTPYEYFHRFKPQLGTHGQFVSWTTQEWRPELNSESTPALIDFLGQPSLFGLDAISQPHARMSFQLTAGMFDSISSLDKSDTLMQIMPLINSNLVNSVLPVLKNGRLHFYFYDTEMGINQWTEMVNPIDLNLDTIEIEPIVADVNNNGYKELIIPKNGGLYSVEISSDIPVSTYYHIQEQDTTITSVIFAFGKLWVATKSRILVLTGDSLNTISFMHGAYKLAADETNLILQRESGNLIVMEPVTYNIVADYNVFEEAKLYELIVVKLAASDIHPKTYIITSDKGNIYTCFDNDITCIFHNNDIANKPTNIAISKLGEYSPVVVFGLGSKLYALTLAGTLLPGYPIYLENYTAKPYSQLKILHTSTNSTKTDSEIIYLKLTDSGYLAINADGTINRVNSIIDVNPVSFDQTYWDSLNQKLFWFFNSTSGSLLVAELDNQTIYPFYWSGYRNGQNGLSELEFLNPVATSAKIDAYAFPNPANDGWVNIRIENPSGTISLHVYDISGMLLYKHNYTTEPVVYKDIYMDISRFSSGVYIAVIESRNQTKRCKFAVEK